MSVNMIAASLRCSSALISIGRRPGDRNFVNIAPLQLGEEVARVHLTCLLWSNMLCSSKQFLEARIAANRVPDRIDF